MNDYRNKNDTSYHLLTLAANHLQHRSKLNLQIATNKNLDTDLVHKC